MNAPAAPAVAPPMPKGIHNAYFFDTFNAMSWTVVLGSPMLLFLQHLRATATIMAVSACLAPLLTILQIPAARFVERVGYRRFVMMQVSQGRRFKFRIHFQVDVVERLHLHRISKARANRILLGFH